MKERFKYNSNNSMLEALDSRHNPNVDSNRLGSVNVLFTDNSFKKLSGGCMEALYKNKKYINKSFYVPIPYKYLFRNIKTKTRKLKRLKEYLRFINQNNEFSLVTNKKEISNIIENNYFNIFESDFNTKIKKLKKKYSLKKQYFSFDTLFNFFDVGTYTSEFHRYNHEYAMKHSTPAIDTSILHETFKEPRVEYDFEKTKAIFNKYCNEVENVNKIRELKQGFYLIHNESPELIRMNNSNLSFDSIAFSKYSILIRRGKNFSTSRIEHNTLSNNSKVKSYEDYKRFSFSNFLNELNQNSYTHHFNEYESEMDSNLKFYTLKNENDIKNLTLELQEQELLQLVEKLKSLRFEPKFEVFSKIIDFNIESIETITLPLLNVILNNKSIDSSILDPDSLKNYRNLVSNFNKDFVICKVNTDNFKHQNYHMKGLYLITLLRYTYFYYTEHIADIMLKMKEEVGNDYSFYEILYAASNVHKNWAWYRFNLVNCRSEFSLGRQSARVKHFLYHGDEVIEDRFKTEGYTLNKIFKGKNKISKSDIEFMQHVNIQEHLPKKGNYRKIIEIFVKR